MANAILDIKSYILDLKFLPQILYGLSILGLK